MNISEFERKYQPVVFSLPMVEEFAKQERSDPDEQNKAEALLKRFERNEVTFEVKDYLHPRLRMMNMYLSRCHACDAFAIWIKDRLPWPVHSLKIEPHPDIPANVKDDFVEAAGIVETSPRGSAALSRFFIIQKLMVDLGESGKDINADIASLVKKGLEVEIQQALDVVRVVGNHAVHPGKIDLKDDVGTALALLQLINLVVERRIATKNELRKCSKRCHPVR